MNTEYEEFENIEDLFMYMSAAAPPMKNTIPINSYKGNIMSFIPLSPSTGESYLMLYAKGELEQEFMNLMYHQNHTKKWNLLKEPIKFTLSH